MGGRKRWKGVRVGSERTSLLEGLPMEIVEGCILTKLPALCVMRLRGVCRKLRHVKQLPPLFPIASSCPFFIAICELALNPALTNQLYYFPLKPTRPPLLRMKSRPVEWGFFVTRSGQRHRSLIDSHAGLLLFTTHRWHQPRQWTKMCVANPLTNESFDVPFHPNLHSGTARIRVDPITFHLTVFAFGGYEAYTTENKVFIYRASFSSRQESWQSIPLPHQLRHPPKTKHPHERFMEIWHDTIFVGGYSGNLREPQDIVLKMIGIDIKGGLMCGSFQGFGNGKVLLGFSHYDGLLLAALALSPYSCPHTHVEIWQLKDQHCWVLLRSREVPNSFTLSAVPMAGGGFLFVGYRSRSKLATLFNAREDSWKEVWLHRCPQPSVLWFVPFEPSFVPLPPWGRVSLTLPQQQPTISQQQRAPPIGRRRITRPLCLP